MTVVVDSQHSDLRITDQLRKTVTQSKPEPKAQVFAYTGPDFFDYIRELKHVWSNNPNRNWRIYSTEIYRRFWDIHVAEPRTR